MKTFYLKAVIMLAILALNGKVVLAQSQTEPDVKAQKKVEIKAKQDAIAECQTKIEKLKNCITSAQHSMGYGSMASNEGMFRQNLEKLETQKASGEISDKEYTERKDRFESLLSDMEKNKKEKKEEVEKIKSKAQEDIKALEGEIKVLEQDIKALRKNNNASK